MLDAHAERDVSRFLVGCLIFILGIYASLKGWKDFLKKDKSIRIQTQTYIENQIVQNSKNGEQVVTNAGNESVFKSSEMEKRQKFLSKYKISLAHPKFLSKRFSSLFMVHIYLPEMRYKVSRRLQQQFEQNKVIEHIQDSDLKLGQELTIKLTSPEIIFSDSTIKKLDNGYQATNFIAKPKDSCYPGNHQVILSICDSKTNFEYHSISFAVQITDFVFDHISRPLVSNVISIVLGIGSLSMYALTLLGQIDSTFGLTSGTVAGALASAIYIRFFSLYQYAKVSSQP